MKDRVLTGTESPSKNKKFTNLKEEDPPLNIQNLVPSGRIYAISKRKNQLPM